MTLMKYTIFHSLNFTNKECGGMSVYMSSVPHNSGCQLEELMNTLERTRQELDATKQRLSSTQQSLQERDSHLTNMRQERRKQLEEILEMKLVS